MIGTYVSDVMAIPDWVQSWRPHLARISVAVAQSGEWQDDYPHVIGPGSCGRASNGSHGTQVCMVEPGRVTCVSEVVLLNPAFERVVAERNVALLFEGLAYVVAMGNAVASGGAQNVISGSIRSSWWSLTDLEPGWYDASGGRIEAEVEVCPAGVSGRAVAMLVPGMPGLEGSQFDVTEPATTDSVLGDFEGREGVFVHRWVLLPSEGSTPAESRTEATADEVIGEPTERERIQALRDRFDAIMQALKTHANEPGPGKGSWCSEYEQVMSSMGIAEEDYRRERTRKYQASISIRYSLGPSDLDEVTQGRFGGDHDIQDSVEWVSSVTIDFEVEPDGGDPEENVTDELLRAHGYQGYDDFDLIDYEEEE